MPVPTGILAQIFAERALRKRAFRTAGALFMPQGVYGIESGRAPRREVAENDPDGRREQKRDGW